MTSPLYSVDYTSRDYASIREDLVSLIPAIVPEWTSRTPNDFGMALLELFAYTADGLHYYADRLANEAFIDTATQRASLLRIARMLNYTPTGNAAATATLQFALDASAPGPVTIPHNTQVVTSVNSAAPNDPPVTYETDTTISVNPGEVTTVTATEGVTIRNEVVGTSDGTLDQTFTLFNSPVIEGSVQVFVDEGTNTQWSFVSNLLLSTPGEHAYTLTTDSDDTVSIRFGDGSAGKVPDRGAVVTATYRVGGGSRGNVASNSITRIVSSGIPAGVTVTNPDAASGGADAESDDMIRTNTPLSLSALNRAVTLADYASIAVGFPGVAKARATSSTANSVNVYIAPYGGGGLTGTGDPKPAFAALKAAVLAFLNERRPVTTTVSVLNPVYVPIDMTITVNVLPKYSQARTQVACAAALTDLLDFDNVVFGDTITPSDIHTVLSAVPGVSYVEITALHRAGDTGNAAVQLDASEIPQPGTIGTDMVGGIV